ncbi:hypothetical protein CHS0354_012197 [Potamilus streckersoni]|uniref:Vesicular, overexpressed in cancer, prosurvival protein 1 n=1 Tax=Potamilus streckersoni TaxID=2493646 RepID=A0AAE0SAJ1_9BIVA|nr:hypothetical protein CHS0354_012197 [Potamilus streckersoni]
MATDDVGKLFILVSFFLKTVFGYYCDSDRCLEDEYCCGENICCVSYKVWELWYFWFGIFLFIVMLSFCICFWRQRSRAYYILFRTPAPYSPLATEGERGYTGSRSESSYITTTEGDTPERSFYKNYPSDTASVYSMFHGEQEFPPPYTDTPQSYSASNTPKKSIR